MVRSSFNWFLCPFNITLSMCVCGHFLIFRHCKMLRLMHIFSSSPRISPFSKELWTLLLRMVLETKIWVKMYLLLKRCCFQTLSADKAKKYMCAQPHVYIHTTINISKCTHLYLYQAKHEFMLLLPALIHYQMDQSSLLLLLIWNLSLQQWEIWLPPFFIYLLIKF